MFNRYYMHYVSLILRLINFNWRSDALDEKKLKIKRSAVYTHETSDHTCHGIHNSLQIFMEKIHLDSTRFFLKTLIREVAYPNINWNIFSTSINYVFIVAVNSRMKATSDLPRVEGQPNTNFCDRLNCLVMNNQNANVESPFLSNAFGRTFGHISRECSVVFSVSTAKLLLVYHVEMVKITIRQISNLFINNTSSFNLN